MQPTALGYMPHNLLWADKVKKKTLKQKLKNSKKRVELPIHIILIRSTTLCDSWKTNDNWAFKFIEVLFVLSSPWTTCGGTSIIIATWGQGQKRTEPAQKVLDSCLPKRAVKWTPLFPYELPYATRV